MRTIAWRQTGAGGWKRATGPDTGFAVNGLAPGSSYEMTMGDGFVLTLGVSAAEPAPTPTPSPTLAALALSSTSVPEDSAATINITGATATSTLALAVGSLPAGMTLNGAARTITGTPTDAATASFTLRETLAGATNSPRDTALSLQVTAVTPAPTPAPAFTTQPSISPLSGQIGATFTANVGVASNASTYARRWLLDGAPIGTGSTVAPSSAGSLVLEVTATGAGGSTIANSTAATVSAVPVPTFSFTASTPHEEGTARVYQLNVARNGATGALSGTWAVTGTGGTPANAADFGGAFPSGNWTIADGASWTNITVTASEDADVEGDETYLLTATRNGSAVATITGTITNDDAPPVTATYYVSPTGSDAAAGTSQGTAWQTTAKVIAEMANLSPGDAVLFQGGQTFDTAAPLELYQQGTMVGDPITIGSYGTGRATIRTMGAVNAVLIYDASGAVVRDLILDGNGIGTMGVYIGNDGSRANREGAIECRNLLIQNFSGRAVSFGGESGTNGFDGATFEDIEVVACGSGFTSYSPGSGTNGPPTHTDVHLTGWSVRDCSSGGIVLGGVDGGSVEYSRATNCGAASTSGPVGIWMYNSRDVAIRYCVSDHNKTANTTDGGGFDIDGGCVDCVIEYCYSYENIGAGFLICTYPAASISNCEIRHCVSVNDNLQGKATYGGLMVFTAGATTITNSRFYNNTVINTNSVAPPISGAINSTGNTVTFANNLLVSTTGRHIAISNNATGLTFINNQHFGAGTYNLAGTNYADFAAYQAARSPSSTYADPALPQTAPLAIVTYDTAALAAAYAPGAPLTGVNPTTFGGTLATLDAFGQPNTNPPVLGAGVAPSAGGGTGNALLLEEGGGVILTENNDRLILEEA